jgi:hypothetical protein
VDGAGTFRNSPPGCESLVKVAARSTKLSNHRNTDVDLVGTTEQNIWTGERVLFLELRENLSAD